MLLGNGGRGIVTTAFMKAVVLVSNGMLSVIYFGSNKSPLRQSN